MAHFRGTVQGNRSETSRLGTKSSGLESHLNGWDLGVSVFLDYSIEDARDIATIKITRGSSYYSEEIVIGKFAIVNDKIKKINV